MFTANRYFVLASLVGVLAVVALLALYRHLTFTALKDHETRSNVSLAHALANSLLPHHRDFVHRAGSIPAEALPRRPETAALRAEVVSRMHGTDVVKVKVYDLAGLTVFSTDPRQIGEDKSENAGFLAARAGRVVSNITFRDRFDAFDRVIVERNVVSSYIPIHAHESAVVEAVFEVYSDVTDLVEDLGAAQWKILLGVVGSVSLLYTILFTVARRADRTIRIKEAERIAEEARARYQAHHDPLTDLPNRLSFAERLEEAVARARRSGRTLPVLFLDLDRFKLVNDSFGHDAGDLVLRIVARRLQSVVREGDAVFRMGADEFTILPEGMDGPESVVSLANRIVEAMGEPMSINGHAVIMTISIGIAVFPQDATSPDTLVKDADSAMSLAKQSGRNRYQFYSPEMNARALDQLALETELQQALRRGEFTLHYQPRVAAADEAVVALEALLRWRSPTRGLVGPGTFIPILEQTGLIEEVGEWVLETACRQAKAWQDAGLGPMRVSVNVSSRQFRAGRLVDSVKAGLAHARLDPRHLELELTESILIDNTESAVETLERLKGVGVQVSIDDFGSGFSSLNYLKLLPIDFLKIDRTFVADLERSARDAAIVNTIVALARNLGLGLVAEGVETPAQAATLRALGCDELQGFHFARPMPARSVTRLLRSRREAGGESSDVLVFPRGSRS